MQFVLPGEAQARADLAAAFRWTARLDWHESIANHFSVAISADPCRFLMNPAGRHFSRVRASELLLLDAQPLAPQQRAQMETVRNMAVRIHEILARFTSIDKELSAVEQPFENVNSAARAQAAGLLHH